jgi:hypothetical protein
LFLLQRFIPSEFTNDVDRAHIVEPAPGVAASKAKIRRAIEAEGSPYTCVATNSFAGFFLPALNQRSSGGLGSFLQSHVQASSIRSTAVTTTSNQPGATASHGDRLVILGDGNVKGNSIF